MTETDMELISKALSGDLLAFDKLVNRYQESVFKLCLSITKNRDTAMDVLQNAFIKTFDKMGTFKGKSSFKSWLLKISYNESINWLRKNKFFLTHETFEENNFILSSNDEEITSEILSLQESVLALNTKYRTILVLRYYDNMSITEISKTMNCSEGVVKNILFRSLRKIKDRLKDNQQTKGV